MQGSEVKESAQTHICQTYVRHDLVLVRGSGCRLWDVEGREYLDFVGGIAVCSLGHCPDYLAEVLYRQARRLVHVSNLYYTEPQVRLAELLTGSSFADKIFFCNSGAEANEAAIKLARKYSRDRHGAGRYGIITMKGSFHGRTMATLSATGQEKVHHGFEPLVDGFRYVEFDNVEAVAAAVDDTVCAVLVEPIQGEGGVRIPGPDYLARLRRLCSERDLLLIYDEVQVGMGRTGALFAYQHEGVAPDIMTLAKALGNGLPIGAMLTTNQVGEAFTPGSHATTFGGTPLVTAVAVEALKRINDPAFLERVRTVGTYFTERLQTLQARYPRLVREVRGRGLIVGMELAVPGKDVVRRCQELGFLINCTVDTVLRFVPPLVVSEAEIDRLLQALDTAFSEL
jgi:acetylornithine/N-succinyldiaminopimelate aminotransferase